MKKALRLFGLVLVLVVLLALPATALDETDTGYTIEDYRIEAVLREDATVDVTETIKVNFTESSRGIFRAFPSTVRVLKETGGKSKTMRYAPKLRDISASEAFAEYSEDGIDYIRLGSEDVWLSGEHEYRIHYVYDMGDDRVPEYDELYWSPAGSDWNTTIKALNFSLTLPKSTALDGLEVYSGGYGTTSNLLASVRGEGLTITGSATRALAPGEGITLRLRLPEGYFSEVQGFNGMPALVMMVGGAALAALIVFKRLSVKKQQVVDTVEFYPPEGITSADAGIIVDGVANDKDLLSLIIWFADQGYLTITGKEETLKLTKIKEPSANWSVAVRALWDGLFVDKKQTVTLSELEGAFYETLNAAKAALTNHYNTKENRLTKPGATATGLICSIGVSVLGFIGILLCGVDIEPGLLFIALIALFAALAVGITGVATAQASRFWSNGTRFGMRLLFGGLYLTILLCGFGASAISLAPKFIPLVLAVAMVAAAWAATGMQQLTEKGAELTRKLLGLRSFIEKAELDRLKLLVEESPEYFYHVLPYAYVFGLSDAWASQFESLAIPAPQWYSSSNGDLFTAIWLTRSLNRSFSQVQTNVMNAAMKNSMNSGGGGGVSFGGGGGFSGGGFGGGGGGRW